jgi:Fatty acid cis/trans isomerase (CTI)
MRGLPTRGHSVLVLSVAAAVVVLGILAPRLRPRPRPFPSAPLDATYPTSIQPIFDRRCVPCHACFDSPCQLTLQSFEGLDRGANKEIVYFPERPLAARPTRMFQDAPTTAAWQFEFDFFPVVDRERPRDLGRSIFWRFLTQRERDPGGSSFDVDEATTCAASVPELDKELHDNPTRGMPFGFPPLLASERDAIAAWLQGGAGGPAAGVGESAQIGPELGAWEDFLNGNDPRTPLVTAYLFEHLFFAHLHFDAAPGEWFRIVRSRTPKGSPIEEIPTRRPYDDPGTTPFFYRLRRIRETLVEKTHAPYLLGAAKLARLRQLFYDPAWSAPPRSAYDRRSAANPFVAFAAIPARARYQFLLDDARYHVQTFIHGPVCRGQAALDVIEEQFLIFFLAPERDPAITDPDYLPRAASDLEIPAERTGSIEAISPEFDAREILYLNKQAPRARSFADVWHGDGTNRDAVLTVFRHFDNAFVLRGAVGGMPKTAWVLDYPIFERMYYDLVAGFDVYGNLTHQIGTRMYMNYLRIEAEGQFLRLLPAAERTRVRDEWYRGRVAHALSSVHDKACAGPETTIVYADPNRTKEELLARLLTKELPAAVVGPREPIQWLDAPLSSEPLRAEFEAKMRELVHKPAPYVAVFPDTVLLRVKTGSGSDLVYTVARNRSHTSVEFIFSEGVELEPAEDSLQIVNGIASSRPNFFLTVDEASLSEFVAAWKGLKQGDGSWSAFAAKYGARRSDPSFWSTFDFFSGAFSALDPIGAAVIDLTRYASD